MKDLKPILSLTKLERWVRWLILNNFDTFKPIRETENTFWKDGEIRFLDNTPEPRAALFIQQPIKMLLLRKRSEDQDHLFLSIFHCSGSFSAFRTWTLGPAIKVLFETFSALILLFSAICTAWSTLWSTE